MVVNQVYVPNTPPFEAEDDAPVAGHLDGPITRQIAFQRV